MGAIEGQWGQLKGADGGHDGVGGASGGGGRGYVNERHEAAN